MWKREPGANADRSLNSEEAGGENDTAVIRIRIKDRKREKIGTLKQFRRTAGPGRCWSGLTPDDCLLVLRDVGSQEIYGLTLEEH